MDTIIIGAGGWGRECAWLFSRGGNLHVIGFADDDVTKVKSMIPVAQGELPVIGTVAEAVAQFPEAAFFVAIGDNARREVVFRQLEGRRIVSYADPTAIIATDVVLGEGTFIGPYAVVSTGAKLGRGVIVNTHGGVGHDVTLGDFTQLCPGVSLSGFTQVGRRVLFGTRSSTVPGITLGDDAKVTAGVPVYKNLRDGETLSPFGCFGRK